MVGIFCKILSIPPNTVVDMNNFMLKIDVPQNIVNDLNNVMFEIDVHILYRTGDCPSLCW